MSETKTHELKTIPPYFEQIRRGIKKFELRKNDRDYRVGDVLVLKEYLPFTQTYTGKETVREIEYILENFDGLQDGYCIMGLGIVEEIPF